MARISPDLLPRSGKLFSFGRIVMMGGVVTRLNSDMKLRIGRGSPIFLDG